MIAVNLFLFLGIVAAGTQMGNVAMWKYSSFTPSTVSQKVDGETKWQLQNPIAVNGPVRQLMVKIPLITNRSSILSLFIFR